MTREAREAEEEPDDEVRADRPRRGKPDAPEQGRHSKRAEDESDRPSDQADDRARDDRCEPGAAGARRGAELEEKLDAVPEERGGDAREEQRLRHPPAEVPAQEGRRYGGRRHPGGDAPVDAAGPRMSNAARERRRSADGDVRPRSRRRAPRRENHGRQAQASEHESDGAAEHTGPERRRGR